jgi:hypothetical protein
MHYLFRVITPQPIHNKSKNIKNVALLQSVNLEGVFFIHLIPHIYPSLSSHFPYSLPVVHPPEPSTLFSIYPHS